MTERVIPCHDATDSYERIGAQQKRTAQEGNNVVLHGVSKPKQKVRKTIQCCADINPKHGLRVPFAEQRRTLNP